MRHPKYCITLALFVAFILFPKADTLAFDRHRLSLSFGGGWNHYAIQGLNNTNITFIRPQYSTVLSRSYSEKLVGGNDFSFGLQYRATKGISIDGSLLYFGSQTQYYRISSNFLDDYANRMPSYSDRLSVSLVAPGIGISHHIRYGKFNMGLSYKIHWLFGQANFDYKGKIVLEDQWAWFGSNADFHGNGMGTSISLNLDYMYAEFLIFKPTIGYRYFPIDKLTDKSGHAWDGMRLDFSGPFAGVDLSFQL
jgi:hypothetical protein